jgi:predicted alpha/beta hydrolase family esterase
MTIKYIIENKIKLDRLIMVAPGASNTIDSRPNLKKFHEDLYENNIELNELVNEVIVVHSKDDDMVPFESGKKVAEKT